ncbi:protein-L-isoaspartate O-methyltransferase family protein [Streptomyces alboflavus]|uniref:protein-L-isoaspartate O-methyltransferase family protein n=1 Tax=Streptomyces alboflavus TaxID=67267 RepID=UPI0036A7B87E
MDNRAFVDRLITRGELPEKWRAPFTRVARADFVPDRVWTKEAGRWIAVDRGRERERWSELVHSPRHLITQLDDGLSDGPGHPTSSSSMPAVNAELLDALDLHAGHQVCEAGAGYGWTAALLSDIAGENNVTTIEIDPDLTRACRIHLHAAGHHPHVVLGDATHGCPRRAPFDRFLSTLAVRRIPPAWLRQTPGGIIVTPFHTPLAPYGLLRLEVSDDGRRAHGRFTGTVAFMWSRPQRPAPWPEETSPVRESLAALDPAALAGDARAQFALGLKLPDLAHAWRYDAGEKHESLRVRVWDEAGSRAVAYCHGPRAVFQSGPRDVWDKVEQAYTWYQDAGTPGLRDFEVTVGPRGRHEIRLPHRGESWVLPPFTPVLPGPQQAGRTAAGAPGPRR